MTVATLTWSPSFKGAASAINSVVGTMDAIKSSIDLAVASALFPWQIASSDMTSTSLRYITLKRKSGAAGRVIIVGVVTADGTWNTMLQATTATASAGIYIGYVAGATSDTPTVGNLRGGSSGTIFTGQTPLTTPPMSSQGTTVSAGSFVEALATEEQVLLYATSSSGTISSPVWMAGEMLASRDDTDARNAAMCTTNLASWGPLVTISNTTNGVFCKDPITGAVEHWGHADSPAPTFNVTKGRDLANKKVYMAPLQLGSHQAPYGNPSVKYQLRQLCFGPYPLASREQLIDTGGVLRGFSLSDYTALTFWAMNIKLNT